MPRTAGVSCRMRSRPTRVRPSPRRVSRWFSVCPLMLRTSLTFKAILRSLLTAQIGQFLAAQPRCFLWAAQLAQAVEGGLDHVVRVPRALALGQDVADTHRLQHRADAAARDHAGSFAGRLEQHLARAEVTEHLVRNG